MSTTTNNLGLIRLGLNDPADISQFNTNWQKIDDVLLNKNAVLLTSEDDLNTVISSGYYFWYSNDKPMNAPSGLNMHYMRVWNGHTTAKCCQEVVAQIGISTNNGNCKIQRTLDSTDIGEWEWVNPPMQPNTEYRTTERYNDQAVFVKLGYDGIIHKRTESGLDITPITYGTTELTEGTSELPTGQLYFVYE